jgi:hypothetical protein
MDKTGGITVEELGRHYRISRVFKNDDGWTVQVIRREKVDYFTGHKEAWYAFFSLDAAGKITKTPPRQTAWKGRTITGLEGWRAT